MLYGNRKLFATLVSLALVGLLAWFGHLDPASAGAIVALCSAFIAGNTLKKPVP